MAYEMIDRPYYGFDPNHYADRWKWRVTCTYNDTVKPPKRPGMLAIQTVHADEVSKDIEIAAAERRGDVDVEVWRIR